MKKLNLLVVLLALMLNACNKDEGATTPQKDDASNPKIERIRTIKVPANSSTSQSAVVINGKTWEPGETIKIKFLNGTTAQQARVKQDAATWLAYANLSFEYTTGNADVRIGFDMDSRGLTWSTIGTDCRLVTDQNEPTLNLVGLEIGVEDDEVIRGEILRGFGHILGLGFEHRSPDSPITFNDVKASIYFGSIYDLSDEDIENDILPRYNTSQTNHTEYDPTSIMMLEIPKGIQNKPTTISTQNTELSEMDKEFITTLYPHVGLKVEWIGDIDYIIDMCTNKYDNVYLVTKESAETDSYISSILKIDTQAQQIIPLFTVPEIYNNVTQIAFDSKENIFLVDNGNAVVFDKHGTLIKNIPNKVINTSPYTYEYYADFKISTQTLRHSILILDNDMLILLGQKINPTTKNLLGYQVYKYDLTSENTILTDLIFSELLPYPIPENYRPFQYLIYVGIAKNDYIYGLYTETDVHLHYKINTTTMGVSTVSINSHTDTNSSFPGTSFMARDKSNIYYLSYSYGVNKRSRSIHEYDIETSQFANFGKIPSTVEKPNHEIIENIGYSNIAAFTRNAKTLYIAGNNNKIYKIILP